MCRAIDCADGKRLKRFIDDFEKLRASLNNGQLAENMRYFDRMQYEFHVYLWQLCPLIIYNEIHNVMDLTKQITARHVSYYIKNGRSIEFAENELDTHIHLAKAIMDREEDKVREYIRKDIQGTKNDILLHYEQIAATETTI